MVKLSPFLFSTDILTTQQKCGCWLYFRLKSASRMFHIIVAFCAQGLLPWYCYHLPSWGREILLHLGKACPSRMHGLERQIEVRKPLQLPESISLSQKFVCVEHEVGQQLNFRMCQSSHWNKGMDDFHHIQMKPEVVFRQGRQYLG